MPPHHGMQNACGPPGTSGGELETFPFTPRRPCLPVGPELGAGCRRVRRPGGYIGGDLRHAAHAQRASSLRQPAAATFTTTVIAAGRGATGTQSGTQSGTPRRTFRGAPRRRVAGPVGRDLGGPRRHPRPRLGAVQQQQGRRRRHKPGSHLRLPRCPRHHLGATPPFWPDREFLGRYQPGLRRPRVGVGFLAQLVCRVQPRRRHSRRQEHDQKVGPQGARVPRPVPRIDRFRVPVLEAPLGDGATRPHLQRQAVQRERRPGDRRHPLRLSFLTVTCPPATAGESPSPAAPLAPGP